MKDEQGTRFIRVELTSNKLVQIGVLKSQADLYPDRFGSEHAFAQAIRTAGAGLAEYQCVKYHDRHDPSSCAKAAYEAWTELKARFESGESAVQADSGT